MRMWIFAALWASRAAAFDGCPDGAERVQTNWPERPWVCALQGGPRDSGECPAGTREVSVPSSTRPSRCALDGADPAPTRKISPSARPASQEPAARCPKGTVAEFGTHLKKGWRCAALKKPVEPEAPKPKSAACPPGTKRVRTEDPFEPVRCAAGGESKPAGLSGSWSRYEVPGELLFEYPEAWHVTDGWKDETPSLFLQPDLARDGKPVSMTITRYKPSNDAYVDMDAAIRQEVEWHGAKEGGKGSVAGLPARFLEVPKQTKLAYLRSGDGYLVLAYSAPEDLFQAYAPAYGKLLKSLRVVHGESDPLPEGEDRP
ncbi:MAG: hypothetical protein HY925_05840 [Elusimicrobia bacterium]|nr:hypothetical protein [Elusimicrobiota bacterium]